MVQSKSPISTSSIPLLRLANQQLIAPEFTSASGLVNWMCALQAQDYPMAKWALGIRLPGSKDKDIEAAVNNADILRTHVLRPTWHFVTPEDICWLLELSAPQIKSSQRSRDRDLELTSEVYYLSNAIIEKALSSRGQLTREELMLELQGAGIATGQNRASHLFMRAELDQIICSGGIQRGKPTYALLSQRVKKSKGMTREDALSELARRYFTSRCPATLQDFTWWSGLPAMQAKKAMQSIASDFETTQIEGQTYWISRELTLPKTTRTFIHLLPTYDEYIISYADRRAAIALELEQHMKEISDRGIFWPIIVINGQVVGTWKRTIQKDSLIFETKLFSSPESRILSLIEQVAVDFATFWEKKLVFHS